MTKPLPSITPKQQAILKLLYTYRFLNRIQIQQLLKHKDKRRIISWLKDLRDKQYVDWHYNATDFIAKSQPGIYYLSLNGIRYLRQLNTYPNDELRKRYKEPTRTRVLIDRCLLIADCCISLQAKSSGEVQYDYKSEATYTDQGDPYSFLSELRPHLYFAKRQDNLTTNYVLEIFDTALPRYQLRKRIKDYIEYLDDWDDNFGLQPIALFVCPTTAELMYVKRRIRTLLEYIGDGEVMLIRVTTLEKIKAKGVTAIIWEEV